MNFADYASLRAALDAGSFRFSPKFAPATFTCSACRKARPLLFSVGTGYAVTRDNEMICYACADKRQRDDMRVAIGPFYCYVSGDARGVTTWTGGTLGDVHAYGESRAGWHGGTIARFHVRDIYGRWWQGRGAGKGMACTLRRLKHVPGYWRGER